MCGVCGIWNHRESEAALRRRLAAMCASMAPRGPDGEGFFTSASVGLGHRRLSIVDLAGGHQPMSNETGSVWIAYNGEIYNHAELRSVLEGHGHVYRSRSDTETIIHAYEDHGPDCVDALRGMFVFAIWDEDRKRLLLARDRLGIKPLYYTWAGDTLVFASEIKALFASGLVRAEPAEGQFCEFLLLGRGTGPETLFAGVRELLPGSVLVIDAEQRAEPRRYWSLPAPEQSADSQKALTARFDELLAESIRLRLMSDVPLGVFLSGGLDSSLIAAIMARESGERLNSFSVGFRDDAASELPYARMVADHTGAHYHEVVLDADAFYEAIPDLVRAHDAPLFFPASVPLYFVSALAAEHGVKVILTGEGADELLAGYDRYPLTLWNGRLARALEAAGGERGMLRITRALVDALPWQGARSKLRRTALYLSASARDLYLDNLLAGIRLETLGQIASESFRRSLAAHDPYAGYVALLERAPGTDPVARLLWLDMQTYLVTLLMKQDRMSMFASVESRVPYLDHRLVEAAALLPASMRLRRLTGKWLLRRIAAPRLPAAILRRKKAGFTMPLASWLRGPLYERVRERLLDGAPGLPDVFSRQALEAVLLEHREGADRTAAIWTALNFVVWWQEFFSPSAQRMPAGEGV